MPPQPTRSDGSDSARQPLSCFCSGAPSGPCFPHSSLFQCFFPAIPFRIRTSGETTRKPCRIRTSKTQDLKPFRMNTYEKNRGGGPPAALLRPPRPRTLLRGATSHPFSQASLRDRDIGPRAKSLVHCLSHGGSHLEGIRHPRPYRRAHTEVPKSSVSPTHQITKASQP